MTIGVPPAQIQVTTPSSCPVSITERKEDVFSCGPAANNIHCTAQGYKATIVNWSLPDGATSACPTPDLSYPSMSAAVRAAVNCKPLKKDETFTWSASCVNCATGQIAEPHIHGEQVEVGQDSYTVWHGNPSSILPGPQPNLLALQLAAFETLPVEALPSPLRDVFQLHPPIPGVEGLTATVTYTFFDEQGIANSSDVHSLSGSAAADGRFHFEHTRNVLSESGASVPLTETLAFDGATYFSGSKGSPYFHAWGSSAPLARTVMGASASFAEPFVRWARSPFSIPLAPGVAHQVEIASNGRAVVRETYPMMSGTGGEWATLYSIDLNAPSHVTSIKTLDPTGAPVRQMDFSDYRTLAGGAWRPFRVVESWFRGDGSVWASMTVEIRRASSSNSTPVAMPSLVGAHDRWFVHL